MQHEASTGYGYGQSHLLKGGASPEQRSRHRFHRPLQQVWKLEHLLACIIQGIS
jgi:hypothetical protein